MSKIKNMSKWQLQPIILGAVLILLMLVFGVINPVFLKWDAIHSILLNAVPVAIVGIGMCVAQTAGYFDLAVGMVGAVAGLICASILTHTGNVPLAVITGLVYGILAGVVSGFLVSGLHMNAFITTYAMQSIYRGIVFIWTNGFPIRLFGEEFNNFTKWGSLMVGGIIQFPILVTIILYVLVFLFMKYRKLGRTIFLVGGNEQCAHISGINVKAVQFFVFMLCDFLAAFAGILFASRIQNASTQLGDTWVMESIAAGLMGGTIAGRSNLWNVLLGVIIVYVVKNGLVIVGLSDYYQYIALGLILFLAVAAQRQKISR